VLELLEGIGGNEWFLDNGGRGVYRGLLNGVLEELALAGAHDWRRLLSFPEKALEWTEADESSLDVALKRYRELGVSDDISNCTTLDEMVDLKESLEQLGKEFGIDFSRNIERLNGEIAEREDARDRYSEGTGISRNAAAGFQPVMTDEDVRQMFGTLHDST
jgi:hypothetical protein